MKGIEGWVLVEFIITAGGTVADARVIDSEPKVIFDRETLRAIKRWKYQPKIVDGQAVPQYNMRELFQFVIENPQ
jgi:protein TonB